MQNHLKPFRVIISLFFLIVAALIFIDFREVFSESFISGFLSLQFGPSVIRFIHIAGITLFGFIFILLITLLFGRVYCSTICPLGIFQDVVSWISKKVRRRMRPYRYALPKNLLRYSLLGLTIIFLLFGSILLMNLLDPYSNFGRFVTYFVRPVAAWINNTLAGTLSSMGVYTLYRVSFPSIQWEIMVFPALMLGLVIWLSYRYGRLYCNTVCPVGTLLGFLSKFSIFRIAIENSGCTNCARCERICKSSCIDFKTNEIDFSRCVGCMNCLNICPENAIKYYFKGRPVPVAVTESEPVEQSGAPDNTKRSFLIVMAASLLGFNKFVSAAEQQGRRLRRRKNNGSNEVQMSRPSTIPENRQYPVSPPGSVSIEKFNKACTACGVCVTKCPGNVLQPSFLEYGLAGFMQPRMDYLSGFCNFDCTTCGEICPTGAIKPLTIEKKHVAQVGVAVFIMENCVVFIDHTDCGACSEHCPTKAVDMVPFTGGVTIPEVTENICIGCGACEYACPTEPYKAIYVEGNPVHVEADRPEHEELERPDTEEFPF